MMGQRPLSRGAGRFSDGSGMLGEVPGLAKDRMNGEKRKERTKLPNVMAAVHKVHVIATKTP